MHLILTADKGCDLFAVLVSCITVLNAFNASNSFSLFLILFGTDWQFSES